MPHADRRRRQPDARRACSRRTSGSSPPARVSQTYYSKEWSEVTPQATLEWTATDDLFLYVTVAKGFKGGGFDDTPANVAQAVDAVRSGRGDQLRDRLQGGHARPTHAPERRRVLMDYKDLQVTQTNAACLCNITDNAASAEIKGVEAEFQFAATERLRLSLAGSYVDATYEDFLESAINPTTGQRLDSSGNRLQRTPETQLTGGVDFTLPLGRLGDALNFRVNYTWQSDMSWATDNIAQGSRLRPARRACRAVAAERAVGRRALGQEPDRRAVPRRTSSRSSARKCRSSACRAPTAST